MCGGEVVLLTSDVVCAARMNGKTYIVPFLGFDRCKLGEYVRRMDELPPRLPMLLALNSHRPCASAESTYTEKTSQSKHACVSVAAKRYSRCEGSTSRSRSTSINAKISQIIFSWLIASAW